MLKKLVFSLCYDFLYHFALTFLDSLVFKSSSSLFLSKPLTSIPFFTCFLDSWGDDVTKEVEQKQAKNKITVSFECQSLKADKAAEDHIKQFMPKLMGMDAVGKLYSYKF